MATIGFHASHEQFPPSRLLKLVREAENAGFQAAMCSDHFHPWSERQGHSGFAWPWLGAALESTSLPFGVVCGLGQRYHPAIVAQAAATLDEMYPGRFWVALGSGEALNESITGAKWPSKEERNAYLKEAAEVIRGLWAGETVSRTGLVTVREARLYTRPPKPPLLVGAALTAETAEWTASWADGLMTVGKDPAEIVRAFRRGGGEGKPMFLQAGISYAKTEEEAVQAAFDQWRHAGLGPGDLAELRTPKEFDEASQRVNPEKMKELLRVSSSVGQHIEWIRKDFELGFQAVYLHHVARDMETFLETFGTRVIPALCR